MLYQYMKLARYRLAVVELLIDPTVRVYERSCVRTINFTLHMTFDVDIWRAGSP